MIKVCLIGASGKMGRAVIEEVNNHKDIETVSYTHLTLPTNREV